VSASLTLLSLTVTAIPPAVAFSLCENHAKVDAIRRAAIMTIITADDIALGIADLLFSAIALSFLDKI
jgi:ABC-type Co2+ transport system permease subunit